jgi:hypothetical protein
VDGKVSLLLILPRKKVVLLMQLTTLSIMDIIIILLPALIRDKKRPVFKSNRGIALFHRLFKLRLFFDMIYYYYIVIDFHFVINKYIYYIKFSLDM